ncbi:MAG: DUF59 domain-containing protein [Elusimicrobia bacterium]|nr:DUF59 domain-containing protein [Elusimicrobiota bacterium]
MRDSGPELIRLKRDCEAIQIPSGQPLPLPAGTVVRVTQALGGTYTVTTEYGEMARIAGKDVDALGLRQEAAPATPATVSEAGAAPAAPATPPSTLPPATARLPSAQVAAADVEKLVWDQLKTVYDPEIPVNVVDLGLVYECQLTPLPGDGNQEKGGGNAGGYQVDVKLTLTAPGCGMGDVLKADAEDKIRSVPGVKKASVELVLEPAWNPGMMSEGAKLELGLL